MPTAARAGCIPTLSLAEGMKKPNQLRIIGGTCRGRLVRFPDVKGLRPTPDRTRETLFNWLQGQIEGARCLDLFAGSGALGLEALSRGAQCVQFVDASARAVRQLADNVALLGFSEQAKVARADSLKWLRQTPQRPFDLIFLDPPFALDLLPPALGMLEQQGWLAERCWIYLEQSSAKPAVELPSGWVQYRQSRAGESACQLLLRSNMPTPSPQVI